LGLDIQFGSSEKKGRYEKIFLNKNCRKTVPKKGVTFFKGRKKKRRAQRPFFGVRFFGALLPISYIAKENHGSWQLVSLRPRKLVPWQLVLWQFKKTRFVETCFVAARKTGFRFAAACFVVGKKKARCLVGIKNRLLQVSKNRFVATRFVVSKK